MTKRTHRKDGGIIKNYEAALKAEAHLEVGNRYGGESGLRRKAAAYKPEPE